MAWIKLHHFKDGRDQYVQTKNISFFHETFGIAKETTITFVGDERLIRVKEPAEEVMQMVFQAERYYDRT